jgi:hypothetical protein
MKLGIEELKGMLSETVKPMLEDYGKAADEKILALVDERIAKATAEVEKTFRVETHENFEDDLTGGFKHFSFFCRDVARAEQ